MQTKAVMHRELVAILRSQCAGIVVAQQLTKLVVVRLLQDMQVRARKRQMEVVWQGTASYGTDGGVFTGNFLSGKPSVCRHTVVPLHTAPSFHGRIPIRRTSRQRCRPAAPSLHMVWSKLADAMTLMAAGNYGPPPGFNWDWGQGDPPLQDDAALYDYNIDDRIDAFVEECMKIFNVTRGNDIMLTMGSDFQA